MEKLEHPLLRKARVINLYYRYPFDTGRFLRLVFLTLSPGVITILCHGGSFFLADLSSATPRSYVYASYPPEGPPPQANNDIASTLEEQAVEVDVLENDRSGMDEEEDDAEQDNLLDDDKQIDRSTVDLDPDVEGLQLQRLTADGSYSVNDGRVIYTPADNFFGVTSIQYTVKSRGGETSNPATLSLHVMNVNDAPEITSVAVNSLAAMAGLPITILLEHLVVSDVDNTADDFLLIVVPGPNYIAVGNTVTPDANYSGPLPVQVQVNDGMALSEPAEIMLNVSAQENTTPHIDGQNPVNVDEDQSRVIVVGTDIIVSDPDEGDVHTVLLQDGENYSVSGATITPDANYHGPLTVPVTVNDGEASSEVFNLAVTVASVNDPPSITGQTGPITTGQGQAFTIALENLVVEDVDHPYPTGFLLTVSDGGNYTVEGTTITPDAGFSGDLSVNVSVADPEGATAAGVLTVSVASNQPPAITGQTELVTNEETAIAVSVSNLTIDDSDSDAFTLRIADGENYTVDGDKVIPDGNFAGDLTVPVVVNDGFNDSAPFNLTITVQNTNDAPVISGQMPLTTPEGQGIALGIEDLIITDPDNDGASLVLSIVAGNNYSVTGNVITPVPGFNGTLTVPVSVSDGVASTPFNVAIDVTPVNDVPVITGHDPLSMTEESSITLLIENVTVEDADNTFPTDFTLTVQAGTDYTFSANTVTPAPDFTGTLSVNVVVSDGQSTSEPHAVAISVTPENDPPVITPGQPVSTNEDTPRTITLDDVVIADPDNTSGFILTVFSGVNYTLDGNTITPDPGYTGPLSVDVQVSDGERVSNILPLPVQVVAVNDRPVITGQVPIETAEDTPVTIQLSHLTVLDPDNTYPSGFTLTVSPGTNYSVSGATVTPATDFNGTLNVGVAVSDGIESSEVFAFQIQVGNANDAPVITGQASVGTNEESPVTLALSHLSVSDPDNAFPIGFSLLVSPGLNYTVTGTTVTPALNFAGVLTIPVRVNDGVNNSATFDFQLQVNQINDAPSFSAIPNLQLSENAPAGTIIIRDISKGPMEEHQQLTFITNSSNTAVIADPVVQYDAASATATLSYVVTPNASGVVTLTVVAIDNGSNTPPNQNSYSASFQVEVLPINTAPTLDVISNVTVSEDAPQQNINLTGISAGPGETQALTVSVAADKPDLLDQLDVLYTSPASTGSLQFVPKANAHGSTTVSVTVTDNGPGVAPNVNSITRTFAIVIQPVNDPPVFTSQPLAVAVVNETYLYGVTALDPDGDKLIMTAPSKPAWAAFAPGANGQATLSGKPPENALGNTTVTLNASDGSSAAQQSFSLYVNVRPTLVPLAITTEEDVPVSLSGSFFTGGYTDRNENNLQQIVITSLPASGTLLRSEQQVKAGDTIPATSLSQLAYHPAENYFGTDSFGWNAFDGYHYSQSSSLVNISVLAINDPPRIVLENDTLRYEVNGEAALLSPLLDIVDPDDDTLRSATITFYEGYRPDTDVLEFQRTSGLRIDFDFQRGILELTGPAPLAEYRSALRSVKYLYQNTIDPILEPKAVSYVARDAEGEGEAANKLIALQYTFIEFNIPSAFTPNGDLANDTWVIDRPGGGLEEMDDAVISIYNKNGALVHRVRGFEQPWDGTMNGEILPADTYFFTIDLRLRSRKTYKGIVTILR